MKTGTSIVVFADGLIRVMRGLTQEQHVESMTALNHKFLTCCWSEEEGCPRCKDLDKKIQEGWRGTIHG